MFSYSAEANVIPVTGDENETCILTALVFLRFSLTGSYLASFVRAREIQIIKIKSLKG